MPRQGPVIHAPCGPRRGTNAENAVRFEFNVNVNVTQSLINDGQEVYNCANTLRRLTTFIQLFPPCHVEVRVETKAEVFQQAVSFPQRGLIPFHDSIREDAPRALGVAQLVLLVLTPMQCRRLHGKKCGQDLCGVVWVVGWSCLPTWPCSAAHLEHDSRSSTFLLLVSSSLHLLLPLVAWAPHISNQVKSPGLLEWKCWQVIISKNLIKVGGKKTLAYFPIN